MLASSGQVGPECGAVCNVGKSILKKKKKKSLFKEQYVPDIYCIKYVHRVVSDDARGRLASTAPYFSVIFFCPFLRICAVDWVRFK